MLGPNDIEEIEIRVIQDVIDTVEHHLRHHELHGRQLTAPRSRLYATVLYAVVASARTQPFRPTLDGADILDTLLGDVDSTDDHFIEDTIMSHTTHAN